MVNYLDFLCYCWFTYRIKMKNYIQILLYVGTIATATSAYVFKYDFAPFIEEYL